MADQKKISALPLASEVKDGDVFVGVQEGVTKRTAVSSLKSYLGGPELDARLFGVVPGVSTPEQALLNAEGINRALDQLGESGGGVLVLPKGNIYLTGTNPTAGSWDNKRAIYLRYDNLTIQGQGVGATVLILVNNANCTVIKLGAYAEYQVAVTHCRVRDLEINANRANQIVPTTTQEHHSGVAVSNNCTHTILENLYVHDCPYYGVGMGQEGLFYCKVKNVETNRTGADGLDWKNNSNDQLGGEIDGLIVRNHGMLPMSNVLTAQAGMDLRSGVHATNILVHEMNGESGLIGIRLQNGTAGETMLRPSTVDHFKVVGSSASDSQGLRIISRGSTASEGEVTGCTDGVSLSNLDCRLSNIKSQNNNVGFRFWSTSDTTEVDTLTCTGLIARSNTQAGIICDSVDENNFLGCDVRNNGIGYDIRTGTTNQRIIGGSCSGNTTNLSDLGTGTVVESVSGLRTRQKVSASVAIDSTGVKNIVLTHNLGLTPAVSDVRLTMRRATNVGDWSVGFLWVTDTNSTQILAQLRVLTASATSGATVNVDADIQSKCTL